MKWFLKNDMNITRDRNGKQSSTRITMLVWSGVVLLAWLWASYTSNELKEIPQSVVYILGILVAGKGVQSFSENKSDNQASTPPTQPPMYNTPPQPVIPTAAIPPFPNVPVPLNTTPR
jgi:hypothetical protein